MASGHVNRTQRPNTWLHRPSLQREDSSCQLGAVHTWPTASVSALQRYVRKWVISGSRLRTLEMTRLPSRPREFHPEPLTEPDLILSHHPARAIARRLPPSAELSGSSWFDPVGPCSTAMTHPLRSTGITPLHHYCRAVRPSPAHRYFRPRGWSRLCFFPWHRRPGSHVPYRSQIELRAVYMPDAAWAVSVHPPSLSRKMGQPPVLTSSKSLSTLHRRFTCVRLSQSCLPESCSGFSATFTTIACMGIWTSRTKT